MMTDNVKTLLFTGLLVISGFTLFVAGVYLALILALRGY